MFAEVFIRLCLNPVFFLLIFCTISFGLHRRSKYGRSQGACAQFTSCRSGASTPAADTTLGEGREQGRELWRASFQEAFFKSDFGVNW